MTTARDAHAKRLMVAGVLSLAGQATALAFMLEATPYTTLAFVGPGVLLILVGMTVFAYASYQEMLSRSQGVSERSFEAGAVIFHQGEPGDSVYVVKRGEVEVLREGFEQPLARLGPGEFFGEMALLTEAPRNATVRAVTPVDVLRMHHEAFRSLYDSIPTLRASIEAISTERRLR